MNSRSDRFSVEMLAEALFTHAGVGSGEPLWVAYSGGCDSQVLLHALVELRRQYSLKLIACHADHGLHSDSADWDRQCANRCQQLGVDYLSRKLALSTFAGGGPEAAAREARYSWFESLLEPGQFLLTAHHADDQAETLLLNLLRGSGVQGLAGMPARRPFGKGELLRPLLSFPRHALRDYAHRQDLRWIEDPSNEALELDRNYLRHRVMPQLRERWPEAISSIVRSAGHAAAAAGLLRDLAEIDLAQCLDANHRSLFSVAPSLDLTPVRELSPGRRENLIRRWIRSSGPTHRPPPLARMREAVRQFVERTPCSGGVVVWEGLELRCYLDRLYLLRSLATLTPAAEECEPGSEQLLATLGVKLRWREVRGRGIARACLQGSGVVLTPRSGGERCRLPGREGARSLKKLYQEAAVPPWERKLLPLLTVDGEIAWAHGIGVCNRFATGAEEQGMEPCFENHSSSSN